MKKLTEQDIKFLEEGSWGLRHIGSRAHFVMHYTRDDIQGDAHALSAMHNLSDPIESRFTNQRGENRLQQFSRKLEEMVRASMMAGNIDRLTDGHFTLISNMTGAKTGDDLDRYPMGKCGKQSIQQNQIAASANFSETEKTKIQSIDEAVEIMMNKAVTMIQEVRKAENNEPAQVPNVAPTEEEKWGVKPISELCEFIQADIDGIKQSTQTGLEDTARLFEKINILQEKDPEIAIHVTRAIIEDPELSDSHGLAAESMQNSFAKLADTAPERGASLAANIADMAKDHSSLQDTAIAGFNRNVGSVARKSPTEAMKIADTTALYAQSSRVKNIAEERFADVEMKAKSFHRSPPTQPKQSPVKM